MSAIQTELCKATGIDPAKYESRKALHADIIKATNKLPDKDWNTLSEAAQDWFNAGADATKAKKEVVEFPDYTAQSSSRRRSSSDDDAPKKEDTKGESLAVEKLQEGDRVCITTKRGKKYEGEVTENSKRKEYVVVKGNDGEDEIDYNKVDWVEVLHGNSGGSEDTGPDVGDEVEFKTTRGKTVRGVLSEITEDTIVIGKDDDYSMDRIDGDIKIIKKAGASGGNGAAETSSRGRRSSSDSDEPKEEKEGRSSNPRGTSVGGRIRQLVAEDLNISKDQVIKTMKKEGIEFKDATVNILYRDACDFVRLLKEAGRLSK